MISPKFLLAGAVALTGVLASGSQAADTAKDAAKSQTGKVAPIQRAPVTKGGGARGPLPDPALLDGSTQTAEKKSEYGMIGDFELPGDENARSGKVGGPQNQSPPPAGGGGAQGGTPPMGLPQGGGGAQGQQQQQPGGAQGAQGGQQAAGGGAQGPENPNAGGNPVAGGGDPGAQAQGIQVAELGGEASGQGQGGTSTGPGGKPPQVAIGDSAMRIEQPAAQPGVVGGPQQQAAGHTQQHDKGTGTGGKGPSGTQGPGRIEKGRSIPAGL
jgi:hypothetical protein